MIIPGWLTAVKMFEVGSFLASEGFIVYLFDFSENGYSGSYTMKKEVSQLFSDIITVLKKIETNLPLYILGHCFGGLITLSLLMMN